MNGNDAKEQAANTAHVHAVEQAAAQALVEEKESESRFRHYGKGPWAAAISALAVVFSLFQMYASTFSAFDAMTLRSWHIIFLLVLSFLMYPAWKGERRSRTRPTLFDALCIAAGLFSFGYLILNYTEITLRGGYFLPVDYFVASVGVIICFEMARRVVGNLAALAGVFFLYNFAGEWIPGAFGHTGFSWDRVVEHMFWGSQGLLGVGVGVSATYIFLFVLFGAFLKYSGFSDFINDLALTLVGRTAGGPAKVSVVASALMGMINGSALANVATTGAITIPLMKKTGYKPEFAAAVEAVASTGGQFAPPIMGAVGFIMAEFLGVPYTKVMLAAAIPAFLYYLTLLMAVHFEARKLGLKGLSPEHIPAAGKVLRERGHLFIPLIVLLWLMFDGYTPLFAAAASIFATVGATWLPSLIGLLRTKTARTFVFVLLLAVLGGLALSGLLSLGAAILTALCVLASAWCSARYRMTPRVVVQALDEGARGAVGVGAACVIIGIIIAPPLLIESPGPLIFKQKRVGRNGRYFYMYKFRSMAVQSAAKEKSQWTTPGDPRVTPIGRFIRKTSIDELPQLFNVLKGDMSLVGPRPERPFFVEKFKEEIPRYMIKHQVRPGMTGWAQVNGYRGDTSITKRIEHDLYYIENWTLGFDFKIMFLTVFKGFINKNAY